MLEVLAAWTRWETGSPDLSRRLGSATARITFLHRAGDVELVVHGSGV